LREDSGSKLCVACQTNRPVNMCLECGAVLCPECIESRTTDYYLCGDCGWVVQPDESGHKPDICPKCDSTEIRTGKRLEDMCSRCHSIRVVAIDERRRTLAHDLRHSIMVLQYGHIRLREFSSKLISAKRLLVSLRMANFLAFNWLEDRVEKLQEEVPAVKSRVVNQADIVARRMAAESNGLMDHEAWAVDQFPFIEGLVNRLTELTKQYRHTVDESLDPLTKSLDELTKQLEGLDYYRKEFSNFYDYAELAVNELPVCALPNIRVTGSDFLKNDKATGTLYVTNKRLVFVAETGTLRKKTGVVFDYPLAYLNEIDEDGRIRRRLVLRMKQGELKISCNEQTEKVLIDYIEIARKFERYIQTDMQRVRKLEQADISVNDARLRIEDLVYTLLSSPKRRTGQTETTSKGAYGTPRDYDTAPYSIRMDQNYRSVRPEAGPLRDDLERNLQRYANSGRIGSVPDEGEARRLGQEARGIEQAVRDMVEGLKNGQLMTQDFVRQYRALMRDSYDTKRRMEYLNRRDPASVW